MVSWVAVGVRMKMHLFVSTSRWQHTHSAFLHLCNSENELSIILKNVHLLGFNYTPGLLVSSKWSVIEVYVTPVKYWWCNTHFNNVLLNTQSLLHTLACLLQMWVFFNFTALSLSNEYKNLVAAKNTKFFFYSYCLHMYIKN